MAGLAVAPALACPSPKPVQFAPATASATLTGGVPRGARECYTLGVRRSQRITITQGANAQSSNAQITGEDTNVVLQLYRPPWRVARADDGLITVTGTALPGTEEGRDAREFSGFAPVTGDYLLVLGTSRGSGSYTITITIR